MTKYRRIVFVFLAVIVLFCSSFTAYAKQTDSLTRNRQSSSKENETQIGLTDFERQIIEYGFELMPYDHPFVIAYENTYGVDINSYRATVNGVEVSGVPFEFGGKYSEQGFSQRWWTRTGVSQYPVGGLDCAGYINWIFAQMGIEVPRSSTGLFFAGNTGVLREMSGIRPHYVLQSLDEARIGDVAYNSQDYSYSSGHGSHTQLYIGTAKKLGIFEELKKIYPDFPGDAHLVLDCGWSDGDKYYNIMKKLKVPNPRRGMAGVGVQFFTSIKSGSKYIYKSPQKVYKWKNKETGNTYKIESRLERNGRLLQYKASRKIEYPINLVRII